MTHEELLAIIHEAARTGATELDLSGKGLTALPAEIGRLASLQGLDLAYNNLTALPAEVGQLTTLKSLELDENQLTELPAEIGYLTSLENLALGHNQLVRLPVEIGKLVALKTLWLEINRLTELPAEMGQLIALRSLMLDGNQLTELPAKIASLVSLSTISLSNNQLTVLPAEIDQLVALEMLWLDGNCLRSLPLQLASCYQLRSLYLRGNPLVSPPPEVVEQGTKAALAYLRERLEDSTPQWVSKMLVVGQGGVGKTSLLKALAGEPHDPEESTTHGIRLGTLAVDHPDEAEVEMRLNTWDFGGQEIYHATHQFFLTNRSLYLVAWNARLGYEQGKLSYWLDAIQALAPESPVLLVATHIDERDADLPYGDLKKKYPQIAGQVEISSLTGQGIEELRKAVAREAAGLPLMGEPWPTHWLNAAEAIRACPEKHISPNELWRLMQAHRVEGTSAQVLARFLHELGEILYFRDHDDLKDTVILKPQWVTEYISKVLESPEVIARHGTFSHRHMDELWADLEPPMRDLFLRLMERFDLSYRTLTEPDVSLVVERLPHERPPYEEKWEAPRAAGRCCEITMKYRLNTVPAGIPTWFIARSHRFSTETHWRTGALFGYEREQPRHLALLQADPHGRIMQLTVRGPSPQNFFALLRDGLELTLNRFPGLKIVRTVPCPGHDGETCPHEFKFEHLERAIERDPPEIECPETGEKVWVPALLFGLQRSVQNDVLDAINELSQAEAERHAAAMDAAEANHRETLSVLWNLKALVQRQFAAEFRREQEKPESHCPNVFALRPKGTRAWKKRLVGQKLELQLYCQEPGCWHPTAEGGKYEIDEPAKWLRTVAPYLQRFITVLKYASPLIGPWLSTRQIEDYETLFKADIEFMDKLVEKLPELKQDPTYDLAEREQAGRIEGAELRAVRQLLEEKDPQQHWGGLRKTLTPEGHWLWLCNEHRQKYIR